MIKYLLLLLLLFSSWAHTDFSGNVVKVIDGDTVDLLIAQNKKIRIRLADIDAPEREQPYGEKSRQFLATLIAGKQVFVKDKGKDIYQRTLGTIYVKKINVNAKMVSNGYAWAYRYKNKATNQTMVLLESQAKQKRLGLWQSKKPVAPWEFRRNK